jgi:hypothetical protein
MNRIVLAIVAALAMSACSKSIAPPATNAIDLAITNAKIWTGDSARPWAEALAADDGKIVAIGSNAEVAAAGSAARTIDANGRLLVPGFIDSHVHFIDGGRQLDSVELRDARTREALAARVAEFAKTLPPGAWITGGSWDSSHWGGEFPTREWIDAATGDRPAWLQRVDGHMGLANTAALKAAGVDRNTKDIAGGEILRDTNGDPTGALKDNAMALIERVVPAPSNELRDRALRAAMKHVNAHGVTSVHNMGTWDDLETFRRGAKTGDLSVRFYAVVPLADWERLRDEMQRGASSDEWVQIGGLKGFVDGSLGSRTAAFFEPFAGTADNRGLFLNTPEQIYAWVSGADKAGLHVMVHAIGDRANHTLLNIYERVAQENGARDRRFRIEHVQHLARADIARFAPLNVVASMQPYHAIDDGRWAERYIGERIATTYAFRDLLDSKARLAFGSDWSVAPPTPLEGIYGAVTRRTLDDKHPQGWVPAQKITVEEALRAYTSGAAYAAFDEQRKGTLARGYLADFVVLDRDVFSIPPEQIRDARVDLTVVDGRIVYERAATSQP